MSTAGRWAPPVAVALDNARQALAATANFDFNRSTDLAISHGNLAAALQAVLAAHDDADRSTAGGDGPVDVLADMARTLADQLAHRTPPWDDQVPEHGALSSTTGRMVHGLEVRLAAAIGRPVVVDAEQDDAARDEYLLLLAAICDAVDLPIPDATDPASGRACLDLYQHRTAYVRGVLGVNLDYPTNSLATSARVIRDLITKRPVTYATFTPDDETAGGAR